MGELPEGWVEVTLGDLGEWRGGGTPSKSNPGYWTNGTVPWVSPKDMKVDEIRTAEDSITIEAVARSATSLVPAGSLLVVVRSGILNRTLPVAISGAEVAVNQDIKALIPHGAVLPKFLAAYFHASESTILHGAAKSGTTVASIDLERLKRQSVPLPPLNEQRRIVARLEELTARTGAARAALEAIPPLLDRFRQSVLAAAFRGDLTADWRAQNPDVEPASELLKRIRAERRRRWEEAELERMRAKGKMPGDDRWKARYVEPEGVDAEGLPELPEGWAWATVGELTSEPLRTGVSIRGSDAPPGTPSLKLSAIRSRQVDYSMVKYVQASPEVATENCVRDGDVFIARGNGSINLVGRCAQAVEPPELTIFPDLMIRVRCVSQMPAALFTILWDSPETRRIIEQKAKTTAGIWKVSQSDLARIPLPVPSYQEAEALVERVEDMLSSAKKESTATETATKMLTTLHQSLLAKAFRGELVPQDPADEPASVLLERIRQEREAAGANGKSRRGRKAKQESSRAGVPILAEESPVRLAESEV